MPIRTVSLGVGGTGRREKEGNNKDHKPACVETRAGGEFGEFSPCCGMCVLCGACDTNPTRLGNFRKATVLTGFSADGLFQGHPRG